MKKVMMIILLGLLLVQPASGSEELSREEQERIINNYLLMTGQSTEHTHASPMETAEGQPPNKCGTPAITNFLSYRDKLDSDMLISLGVKNQPRPVLDSSYASPGGKFRIHYSVTGGDAVWQVGTDSDNNGVPDYIDTVAMVADSVWVHQIIDLGFPSPVVDTACAEGGDERFDIYVIDIPENVFGYTYPEVDCMVPGSELMQVPAFIVLDNDYQHVSIYRNKPADAVRVTVAHEFFHVVQFGMDFTEIYGTDGNPKGNGYWLEMSATWMEEYIYDDINDYYAYLPSFFAQPNTSIQQRPDLGLHAYGSVVYPIFLSEKYGNGIIKAIWERSVELGPGGNFLQAAEQVIIAASDSTEDWATSFAEFSLWNFFTGFRAALAPSGMAYSEGSNYPLFDTLEIATHISYPVPVIRSDSNAYKPEHNAVSILQFKNTTLIKEERMWRCDSARFFNPICKQDSSIAVEVTDSLEIWDILDTSFSVAGALESMQGTVDGELVLTPWAISFVKQLEAFPDSIEVDQYFLPSVPCRGSNCFTTFFFTETDRINQFRSVTMLITPASIIDTLYRERRGRDIAYSVPELNSGDTAIVVSDSSYTATAQKLLIYPNPAVVVNMGGEPVRIRMANLRSHGLDLTNDLSVDVRMKLNMYDLSGQIIFSKDTTENRFLTDFLNVDGAPLDIPWDMNNQSGHPVVSGVYFCVVEMFVNRQLVSLGKGKVAVIR